jgi:uncharacterized protein (TIGR03435 family)
MRSAAILLASVFLLAAADRPAFDVASIKTNTSGDPRVPSMRALRGRFVAANITPRTLIEFAYHVPPGKGLVREAPPWLDSAHFDIEAKGTGAPTMRIAS